MPREQEARINEERGPKSVRGGDKLQKNHKNPGPRQLSRGRAPMWLNAYKPCILAIRESATDLGEHPG